MKNRLLINIINIFKHHNSPLGFTLIELLVATVMSTIVIGGAGYGLVSILEVNQSEQSKTQRQLELNRAMEFISEEVKMSSNVTASSNNLVLTIPSSASAVTYSTDSSSSAGSIWLNNFIVNRKEGTNPNAVLVDALVVPSTSEINPIKTACTTASATFIPNDITTGKGFYACIYSDNRRVDLYMYGKTGSKSDDYVKVKTTAFARAK